MKTEIIKYNLNDRGRQFRGKNRQWDIPSIVEAINSPACQEKVRNRDMIGYYGHWCRVRYGLDPAEGGIEKGKPYFIEPAVVTTYLKAYPDGTIEHQEEFLETASGKAASQLFKSRVGGFSSAIRTGRNPEFFGFDYVFEPNYATNRGFALDSVNGILDVVSDMTPAEIDAEIQREQVSGLLALLETQQSVMDSANQTIEKLQSDNQSLQAALDAIARAQLFAQKEKEEEEKKATIDKQSRKYDFRNNAKRDFLDGVRAFDSCRDSDLPFVREQPAFDGVEEDIKSIPLYKHFLGG